jgi:hypothetical protein
VASRRARAPCALLDAAGEPEDFRWLFACHQQCRDLRSAPMRKGLRIAMPCRPAARTCPYYLKAKSERVGEERTKVLLLACCIQEGARTGGGMRRW